MFGKTIPDDLAGAMSMNAAIGIGGWIAARYTALVPCWLRAMFAGYPLAYPVVFTPSDKASSRGLKPLDMVTEDGVRPPRRQARCIDAVMPADLFLRRTVRVPKTAQSKLTASAELDLRQRTPFRLDEVYWQLGRPKLHGGFVETTQWVVKRVDVDQWRRRLASHGYQVRRIMVQGNEGNGPIVDFSHQLAPWRRSLIWINGSLAAAAIAAALAGWIYPAWVAQQQSEVLQAQLLDLQGRAVDLRREVDRLRSQDAERTAFLDTILRRSLLVDTLRDLTVALPDDVWISSLVYTPQRAVLNGETAGSAADLVLKLSAKRGLGNPRLSGPVQRSSSNGERFEITVDLGASG